MIVLPVSGIESSIYHVKLHTGWKQHFLFVGNVENDEISRPVFDRILNSTFPANAVD